MEQLFTNFEQYGGWAILFGLVTGSVLLAFAGYINWYGTGKTWAMKWITKIVHHVPLGTEADAENVFGGITTFLVAMGIIMIAAAFLLLGNPPA